MKAVSITLTLILQFDEIFWKILKEVRDLELFDLKKSLDISFEFCSKLNDKRRFSYLFICDTKFISSSSNLPKYQPWCSWCTLHVILCHTLFERNILILTHATLMAIYFSPNLLYDHWDAHQTCMCFIFWLTLYRNLLALFESFMILLRLLKVNSFK